MQDVVDLFFFVEHFFDHLLEQLRFLDLVFRCLELLLDLLSLDFVLLLFPQVLLLFFFVLVERRLDRVPLASSV